MLVDTGDVVNLAVHELRGVLVVFHQYRGSERLTALLFFDHPPYHSLFLCRLPHCRCLTEDIRTKSPRHGGDSQVGGAFGYY